MISTYICEHTANQNEHWEFHNSIDGHKIIAIKINEYGAEKIDWSNILVMKTAAQRANINVEIFGNANSLSLRQIAENNPEVENTLFNALDTKNKNSTLILVFQCHTNPKKLHIT